MVVVVVSLKADQAFEGLSADFVWKSGSVVLHCCIGLFGLDSSNLACCTVIQKEVVSLVLVTLLEFEEPCCTCQDFHPLSVHLSEVGDTLLHQLGHALPDQKHNHPNHPLCCSPHLPGSHLLLSG